MASLPFLVAAAVLAIAVALPPVQETTTSRVPVFEINYLNPATAACKQFEGQESCHRECIYKQFGWLDKDGRYVESKVVELIAMFSIPEGKLTQEQVNQIGKACNSLNDDIKPGCERGEQLWNCLDHERAKVTNTLRVKAFDENYMNPAKAACKQFEGQKSCHRECIYKQFGWLDKDDRYVESKVVEVLSEFSIAGGRLTQEQVNKIGKACNSLNDDIKHGCERGEQLWNCIVTERFKLTGSET